MNNEDIKELFAEWGLWSLIDDISDDGDGHGDNLQLTKEGLEAERMLNLLLSDQSQKQPEKQEEWERELRFTYGHLYYQNEEGEFCQIVNEIDDLIDFISQLLSESKEKAKIEVLEKVLEKKTNYEIEREEHGYRVTLEYVLADDIKKEIKLLKEGDDLQE